MSGMTDAGLRYAVDGAIATITLDRPERKNAFTLDTIDAWVDALHAAAADDGVRVVVLAATGDVFCAGIDLDAFAEVEPTPLARKEVLTRRIHRVALALDELDKPTIAAVNGAAVGAGMDMALLCDMRIAARSARFCEAYIKVGLVPGDGGAWLLPRLVGPGKAMELLLTGAWVDSAEAERLGIVNTVVEDADLPAATAGLAARIAGAPPVQVAMIRRLVRQSGSIDLRTHFDLVSSHAGIVGAINDAARDARS
ncbi:enoyl-CoA hydratase/isomerase family protein [Pseudonocardia sp. CA-107938]|uniref:enoyl-CoA hydratase/isomerase family protein n=1 Tax=Pseudonocardia sp. CA-107938 TaxID=3240021 RepID=UPI003D9418F2